MTTRAGFRCSVGIAGGIAKRRSRPILRRWAVVATLLAQSAFAESPAPAVDELTVTVACPGRSAARIEADVTVPIEKALVGPPAVGRVRSHTRDGVSQTFVTRSGGSHPDAFVAAVRAALARLDPPLPCPVEIGAVHPQEAAAPNA